MKILVDISVLELPLTGVGRALLGLYEASIKLDSTLEVKGFHFGTLKTKLPSFIKEERWANISWRVFGKNIGISYFLRIEKPEVIHFPWNGGVISGPRKSKIVMTLHDVIPLVLPHFYFKSVEDERQFKKRLQRELDLTDMVITDSEHSKKDILFFLKPRSEPVVIYCATNLGEYYSAIELKNSLQNPYFVYFGGYDIRKGLDMLVSVYYQLFMEGSVECPLIIAGEPLYFSEEFYKKLIMARNSGAVIEKGYVGDSELARLIQGALALIYPSWYEGFGYPPLEAMSLGCPVITTNVSSLPEICGDAALYVSPGDEQGLAEAIKRIYRDKELRQALKKRGLEQAKKFSWENSAKKYLNELYKLVNFTNQ